MQGIASPESVVSNVAICSVNRQRAAHALPLGLSRRHLFRTKGDAVTILAIWFGVAVVVGVLLGYAASRLKRAPERQLDIQKVGDADVDQQKPAAPRQSSMKTNKNNRRQRHKRRHTPSKCGIPLVAGEEATVTVARPRKEQP